MKFKVPLFIAVLTFMTALTLYRPLSVLAQEIPGDPVPASRTSLEITERKLQLTLFEDLTEVESIYTLNNPSNRKIKISLRFPFVPAGSLKPEEALKAWWKDEEIEVSYNSRQKSFYWDITLEPAEESVLNLNYHLRNITDNEGNLVLSYDSSPGPLWSGQEKANSTLMLVLDEIHPGQIGDIKPGTYKIEGNSLVWNWKGPLKEKITFYANIKDELNGWSELLSPGETDQLEILLKFRDYRSIANFFGSKASAAKKEEKEDFQVAEAYYLTKANANAEELWKDLYRDKALSPRVYWELGKIYQGRTEELEDLYQRVKELQVHPFTQSWLAAQIPSTRINLSPPELILATTQLEKGDSGLVVKGHFSDEDGDIEQIILKYHWEDEPGQEIILPLEPFYYDYTPSRFIPAKEPLQRLFYEFIVRDRAGNHATSGTKESFYLNSEIYSETYMLDCANLVLGDYPPAEQDEVRKWFASYLKMAGAAQFIPIKERRPYFIFLGKNHDFISTYNGPHFIMYTPVPFSPEATKPYVHRYFLSHWYGPGWLQLSDKELGQLGDALLLGRGRYAMVMKYLSAKDQHKFADLLGAIGQGASWRQSLLDIYRMPFWQVQMRTIWFVYGNSVLAVFIIIAFAWLGKSGNLVKIINIFKKLRP